MKTIRLRDLAPTCPTFVGMANSRLTRVTADTGHVVAIEPPPKTIPSSPLEYPRDLFDWEDESSFTREDYLANFDDAREAIEFEMAVTMGPREHLPPCVLAVRDRTAEPTSEYWEFLIKQL